jgi:hypothetical protein
MEYCLTLAIHITPEDWMLSLILVLRIGIRQHLTMMLQKLFSQMNGVVAVDQGAGLGIH